MPLPGRNDFVRLVQQVCRDVAKRMRVRNELSPQDQERLIANLRGLTLLEAKKILTRVLIEEGRLSTDGTQAVIQAKREIIEKEGLLEYYPVEESLADIADLAGLKQWLEKRKSIIMDPENARTYGLSFPKGILLLGVPGTGKTLCAKAVAKEWALPLLKMDPANLYNKYIGESEKNFKRAMQTAEKMAPRLNRLLFPHCIPVSRSRKSWIWLVFWMKPARRSRFAVLAPSISRLYGSGPARGRSAQIELETGSNNNHIQSGVFILFCLVRPLSAFCPR
ncbi:MAG: AAA family ATPase [Desulfobacteraceae bacterium]|nr:MAG: AAA family ATPase [Desulfobacteraceae bacterium]